MESVGYTRRRKQVLVGIPLFEETGTLSLFTIFLYPKVESEGSTIWFVIVPFLISQFVWTARNRRLYGRRGGP